MTGGRPIINNKETIPITIRKTTHSRFLLLKEKYKGTFFNGSTKTHDDFLEFLLNLYVKRKKIKRPKVIIEL